MAKNLDSYLAARRAAATDAFMEKTGQAAGAAAQKKKSNIKGATTLIGGAVGAYFGNPALGAQVGAAAGDLVGDAATSNQRENMAKVEKPETDVYGNLASLISTFQKYGGTEDQGPSFEKMDDIAIVEQLKQNPDTYNSAKFQNYLKTRNKPLPAF
jgi:hypothetical protein